MTAKNVCLIEEIQESRFIVESAGEGKPKVYRLEGIFMQSNLKNQNGRTYPKKVLTEAVDVYRNTFMKNGRGYGELGHPNEPGIHLKNVCILTQELTEDGNNYLGKAKVIDTPSGRIVKTLIDEGVTLGVSSRGRPGPKGIKSGVVQEGFRLVTAVDVVADPSAPDAFVEALMEGKEWVWDNGILVEQDVAEIAEGVRSANMQHLHSAKIAAMTAFFAKIKGN